MRDVRGKGKEDARDEVVVETPTDLRVYIDPRCPVTVDWFETMFCTSGRERLGVRIDVGGESIPSSHCCFRRTDAGSTGEELIIFPSHPPSMTLSSPAAVGVSAPSRPPLTLSLGRASAPKVRRPRPDDPMPRGGFPLPGARTDHLLADWTVRITLHQRFATNRIPPCPRIQQEEEAYTPRICHLLPYDSTTSPVDDQRTSTPRTIQFRRVRCPWSSQGQQQGESSFQNQGRAT